ncbi:cobaltochelatase subunit CobN [Pseudomonas aeruginosa VRFPA02]|nr:cobaltochelatase subunit CobN [Pseudomonas aeruginosa VRFPA02]
MRLLSSDFVLPGKHQRLAGWAREAGVELRGLRLASRSPASPTTWPGAPRAGPAMLRASPS